MINSLVIFFRNRSFRTAGLFFAINSIMFGSWITRLPDIQHRIQISDGELGLALLGLPIGSVEIYYF